MFPAIARSITRPPNAFITVLLLFKKEQCEWFTRDSSRLLAKNKQFAKKNPYFLYVFDSFSLLCCLLLFKREWFNYSALYKRATWANHSCHSFKKSHVGNLLRSLMTIEWPWAICSGRSWQKSEGSYLLFFLTSELLIHSFANKNDERNSQPCQRETISLLIRQRLAVFWPEKDWQFAYKRETSSLLFRERLTVCCSDRD